MLKLRRAIDGEEALQARVHRLGRLARGCVRRWITRSMIRRKVVSDDVRCPRHPLATASQLPSLASPQAGRGYTRAMTSSSRGDPGGSNA